MMTQLSVLGRYPFKAARVECAGAPEIADAAEGQFGVDVVNALFPEMTLVYNYSNL